MTQPSHVVDDRTPLLSENRSVLSSAVLETLSEVILNHNVTVRLVFSADQLCDVARISSSSNDHHFQAK